MCRVIFRILTFSVCFGKVVFGVLQCPNFKKLSFDHVPDLEDYLPSAHYTEIEKSFHECVQACFHEDQCLTLAHRQNMCWLYPKYTSRSDEGLDSLSVRSFFKKDLCSSGYNPVGLKCLRMVDWEMNPGEARSFCQSDYAQLLKYKDINMVDNIKEFCEDNEYPMGYYWVDGTYDTTQWLWADGDVIGNELFGPGGPGQFSTQACVRLFISETYTYLTGSSCSNRYRYFCEKTFGT